MVFNVGRLVRIGEDAASSVPDLAVLSGGSLMSMILLSLGRCVYSRFAKTTPVTGTKSLFFAIPECFKKNEKTRLIRDLNRYSVFL
jgi:hypothetical protein